jgi:DNA repair protein RecO (recombination protein O)
MSSEKSLALVLRVVHFSETSSIVTLFTQDFGKISGLAKGARRRKSPFEAALDLLAICRVVFIHKQSESLDLLTEAKLERRFRAGTRDLQLLYTGYYVLELLGALTDHADPAPQLFDATMNTIIALDSGQSPRLWGTWWETQLLQALGHFPQLEHCVECGRDVSTQSAAVFGVIAGGVLCEQCKQGQRHLLRISLNSLELLRHLAAARNPEQAVQRIGPEIRGLMNQYLASLLGRRPRMLEHLSSVLS